MQLPCRCTPHPCAALVSAAIFPRSSQQYRTTGGAGVGGSYGPTSSSDADTRCKTALSIDSSLKPQAGAQAAPSGPQDQPGAASGQAQDLRPDSQAGDASGISRASGGAGIGGSYGPAVMAEVAKRSGQQQSSEAQGTAANEAGAEQGQQRSKL